jgi:radical SAM-linked protein
VQRLQILFRKGSVARFLSHLDLLATLEYAMRRARLPLALAEGYNPRPRMSLALPLPVGYLGEREILEITLREPRPPSEVADALNAALPSGLEVIAIEETDVRRRHVASRLRAAVYRIELPSPVSDLALRVDLLLAQERIEIEEIREDAVRVRDLRPLVLDLAVLDNSTLRLRTALREAAGARPEHVLSELGISADGVLITREKIEAAEPAMRTSDERTLGRLEEP